MEKLFQEYQNVLDPNNPKIKPGLLNACILDFIIKYCRPINWPKDLWEEFSYANTGSGENWGIWRKFPELKIRVFPESLLKKYKNTEQIEHSDDIVCRGSFLSPEIYDYISFIIDFVENKKINGISGWLEHLKSYNWPNYQQGLKKREEFFNEMNFQFDNYEKTKFLRLCEKIRIWSGNKTPIDDNLSRKIYTIIKYLKSESTHEIIEWKRIENRRIATLSKIYAFSDPWHWSIYDSRVGCALNQFTFLFKTKFHDKYNLLNGSIDFPVPPDIENKRKSLLSIKGEYVQFESPLWFVRASWVFQEIADCLNKNNYRKPDAFIDPVDSWEVYHVEMVFFMLGKEPVTIVNADKLISQTG